MDLAQREFGWMDSYLAQGSFGQYLAIYPELDLVAVRMADAGGSYDPATDVFTEFPYLARQLAE